MTQPKQRLRLGILGLSEGSWAAEAHLPGLLAEQSYYKIVGLCNSSVESAKRAIAHFQLPNDTRAYGDPQELADDVDIDVVICSVRVDRHLPTILPCIKAGKRIYLEWPIASNLREIEEIVSAAKVSGAEVAVNLQARWTPPVTAIRKIIRGGRLGKVLSSEVRSFNSTTPRDSMWKDSLYYTRSDIGGNPMTIGFGHMIDMILATIGEVAEGSSKARTSILRKTLKVIDNNAQQVAGETITSDVPDILTLHGILIGEYAPGALLSVMFRRGQQFKDEHSFIWYINCEKGEIRLRAFGGSALHQPGSFLNNSPPELEIHHFNDDSVEHVDWSWPEDKTGLPIGARAVASCLDSFASSNMEGFVSLESATMRAKQIEGWLYGGEW